MKANNKKIINKKDLNLHPKWHFKEYINNLTKDYVRRVEFYRLLKRDMDKNNELD